MLQQDFSSYWNRTENRLRADDVNEILAWAEYCIAKRLGSNAFEQSIVPHLSHSCQRDFTFKQIDVKVKELWTNPRNLSRPNGEAISDHTIVYRTGTRALRGGDFTDERIQIVKTRVQQLMKQPVPEYAKPSSRSARKKRRFQYTRTGDSVAKRLFKQTKRSQIARYREHSVLASPPKTSISVQIPPSRATAVEAAHAQLSDRAQSVVLKREDDAISHSSTLSPISNVIGDSQSPTASWCIASPEVFLTPPRETAQLNRARSAASPLISFAKNDSSYSLSEYETVQELLSDRERDLQHLRAKISELYRTIDDLTTQLASKERTSAICKSAEGAPTQKTLSSYLVQIEILESQILNKKVFAPFTTRDIRKHMPFNNEYFQDRMIDIRNEIDDFMCCYNELSRPCHSIKLQDAPDDLRTLLHRVLGNSRDTLRAVSFHSLLQSILSAAVCEWVLECSVQEPMITGGHLRDTMLSHLTTMDDEDVAQNLDFAAHHTLIEGDDFQHELIPRRAESLAMRLCDRVEPLFGLQTPLDQWEVNIIQEWRKQRPKLKKIFVSALKVKTKALVSKYIFEVIFPAPGCTYDPAHAEIERLEQDNPRSDPGQSPIVRLCLVPGLRKFASDRKLVDYNSFQRPSARSAEPGDDIASPLIIPEW